jgi:hypothetical protein
MEDFWMSSSKPAPLDDEMFVQVSNFFPFHSFRSNVFLSRSKQTTQQVGRSSCTNTALL